MKQMKNTILLFVIAFAMTSSYSQCACCAGAGTGSSNGDYNSGVITLNKNQFVIETYTDYRKINEGNATEEDEKLLQSMFINSFGVRYGISNKITVSTLIPYVTLNTNNGHDKGFGDLVLLGTFNLFSKNNYNVGIQAGVELPTGIQKESNFDNSTVVIGSGSFDPMLGLIMSKRWDKFTLQGNGMYKFTTKGFQNNYYGSTSVQNLIVSYKIKQRDKLSTENTNEKETSNFGLSIFAGYYGEWLDNLKEEYVIDENSGYYLGFANLGTNISYKKWILPITLSLPFVKQMNGEQNEAGIRIRLGLVRTF